MNKQTANGKHELNGFTGMSVETLEKELEKFRKPGRPSNHVVALRNALEKRKGHHDMHELHALLWALDKIWGPGLLARHLSRELADELRLMFQEATND